MKATWTKTHSLLLICSLVLLAGCLQEDAVTITKLDKASMPNLDQPASPKLLLYTLVAVLVSILVALAAVFTVDQFDHTLRSALEAERYLGVPVLGSVKKRGRRLIVSV